MFINDLSSLLATGHTYKIPSAFPPLFCWLLFSQCISPDPCSAQTGHGRRKNVDGGAGGGY